MIAIDGWVQSSQEEKMGMVLVIVGQRQLL